MSTHQHLSRQVFLENVRQSGLLSDGQIAQVETKLPDNNRGRAAARVLIELGLLTKFQAERLLAGRTAGFQLGQYRILDQLGCGGMGRVFKAKHRTMERVVALKVLAPGVMKTDRAQELFLREVRAAATLNHPNIVTAYDANEADGRYFLVLEYVNGPNLEQLVRDHGPLPVSQACDYMRQTALGLQCAHLHGMVHRDIKPANLLVQRGGLDGKSPDVIKISDFGLARLHAPNGPADGDTSPAGTILIKENMVLGTPDYLSPEQARNLHKTDIRSDLYSLGCTFYYLLTGQVPFPDGTIMDKLISHSTERPQPIAELRSAVPAAVTAIVDRLLAKYPEDRYQTPAELAETLAPLAVGDSTPWAPVPPAAPAAPLDESGDSEASGGFMSDPDLAGMASNELSALLNTVSNEFSPTPQDPEPIITPRRKTLLRAPVPAPHQRRWLPAVLLALGVLTTLGIGVGLMALAMRR